MAKVNQNLERISITIPPALLRQMELQVRQGMFSSVSEWIRHAIREQITRDSGPLATLADQEPQILDSISQARAGEVHKLDLKKLKKAATD